VGRMSFANEGGSVQGVGKRLQTGETQRTGWWGKARDTLSKCRGLPFLEQVTTRAPLLCFCMMKGSKDPRAVPRKDHQKALSGLQTFAGLYPPLLMGRALA